MRKKKPRAVAAMTPEKCREIREDLELTQPEFAEHLGVKVLAVSRWERGLVPISQGRAMSIVALWNTLGDGEVDEEDLEEDADDDDGDDGAEVP